MIKHAIKYSLLVFIVLAGLFAFASGFIFVDDTSNNNIKTKINLVSPKAFSQRFKRLEFVLANKSNAKVFADSIELITDPFERNYLLALFQKRNTEYGSSFNQLYQLLPNLPEYFPFYDELIFTAKSSGNLNLINDFITDLKKQNTYTDYLSALLYYHTNKYSKAIEFIKNNKSFETLYLLSYCYRGLGDYENALLALNEIKALLNENDLRLSKVMIAEGSLFLLSGDYSNAAKIYRTGLQSAQKTGCKQEEIKANINLAIIDFETGFVSKAQSSLELALQMARSIENQELEATVLSELAVSYTYSGNLVEAKNNYEKSFELFTKLNHKERLSNLSANIGSIYLQMNSYAAALDFYNKGLEYAGENAISKIMNLRGLGDVYQNLSNYSKALSYYEKAKIIAEQIKDISSISSIDVSIGTLFFNINKPNKALEIFLNAKNKSSKDSDPYLYEDINFKTGLAYSSIDSIAKSNVFFNEALSTAISLGDTYYEVLISTEIEFNLLQQKSFDKAENILISSLNKSKSNGFMQLAGVQNLYLATLYFEKKQIQKAISFYNQASLIAYRQQNYTTFIEAEYQLAKLFQSQNNFADAEMHLKKATATADIISASLSSNSEIQISHFSGVNDCYNLLAEIYLAQNKFDDAFTVIESSRSRNTFQNINNLKINSFIKDRNLLIKYYDLQWMIGSGLYSGSKLAEIENEFDVIKNRVKDSYKGWNILDVSNNAIDISSIRNSLNNGENIISLFFSEDKLYFFRITNKSFSVDNLDITKAQCAEYLSQITPLFNSESVNENIYLNQDLFSFNSKAANDFYNKLIKPALKNIPAGDKLIFSMPSELSFVPLEFLVTDFKIDDSPFYYDNKKFLIDDYSVSYSPSASIYALQKGIKNYSADKVLLVGDPQISNKDFSISYRGGLLEDESFNSRNIVLFPLRYSKEEVENLNSLFNDGFVLLSEDATENNFKEYASQSAVIHLSTHSFLYKNQPLIVFSQTDDTKEDGFLESGEILELNLKSELVVLSSCRSGIGAVDKAEGVLGMQKSFFEAGAKSVVVSLWDVSDKYTSLFMQSFYKYLSEGFDKTESLRKAKIFFRSNYSANPYYWSAFVLSGDIAKIKLAKSSSSGMLIIGVVLFLIFSISLWIYKTKKTANERIKLS